jgi:hypothetical protein
LWHNPPVTRFANIIPFWRNWWPNPACDATRLWPVLQTSSLSPLPTRYMPGFAFESKVYSSRFFCYFGCFYFAWGHFPWDVISLYSDVNLSRACSRLSPQDSQDLRRPQEGCAL